MLSLDDLLAPITPSVFHADYDDRKPLHIPASTGPAAPGVPKYVLLDWALQQPRLALEDMIARFNFVPEADLRTMIDAAVRSGAMVRL
ncbi:hypothetical protein [Brevundimonas sp.]|uniref:hypothetical protein n=1 Tax=Brevundimonas sp. TaxID=1871086 RepID=UPI003D134139